MKDPVDRILRDAIRKCDKMSVSWTNGEMTGHLDSVDHEFIIDVSNAFAGCATGWNKQETPFRGRESSKTYATSCGLRCDGWTKPENSQGGVLNNKIMDYKEKYEKAIGRAEAAYGTGAYDDATLEFIFPQLRESEDERIRKHLIEIVETYWGKTNDHGKAADLAWLEKQKENPKSADSIPSDCTSDVKYEDRWHKVANSLPDNGRDVLAKDALGNFLLASFDGDRWYISGYDNEDKPIVYTPAIEEWCDIPSEKQKEQKPAEWSNEDEKKITFLERLIRYNVPEGQYGWTDGHKGGFITKLEAIAMLKSLRPQPKQEWSEVELEFRGEKVKVKRPFFRDDKGRGYSTTEQDEDVAWYALRAWCEKKGVSLYDLYPREEWSEEDEENFKWFDKLFRAESIVSGGRDIPQDKYLWFKSLKPQPKQEWSEAEEETLNGVIDSLRRYKFQAPNEVVDKQILWLKSLRPSWKPSEEQMKALLNAEGYLREGDQFDSAKSIAQLYEQLKKL